LNSLGFYDDATLMLRHLVTEDVTEDKWPAEIKINGAKKMSVAGRQKKMK